jgi:hypothetical protein
MIRFIGVDLLMGLFVDLKLKDLRLKYFALIIPIVSVGCTKNADKEERQDKGTVGTSVETMVNHEGESVDVDFKKFIVKFSSDSIYQSEHVQFPLKVTKVPDPVLSQDEETSDSTYTIDKSQYTLLDLVNPSSENYGDVVSVNTYSEKGKMMVEVSGREGRIHLEYLFYRQNKEWFLKEIIDYNL